MTQDTLMTQETATTQERVEADPQRGRLWLLFLSGPVVHIVYFFVIWAVGEFGCLAGIQQLTFLGMNPIRLSVVVSTIIAALVTLTLGIISFRRWDRLREGPEDPDEDDPKFMLFVGTWLNGLFTVVILLSAVPMLLGSACDWL